MTYGTDATDPTEVGPLRVRVVYDDDPSSPREWDNLGVMVCGHDRYDLGDEKIDPNYDERYPSLRNYLIAEHDALIDTVLPLYLMDHSGISMSTGDFGDPWDSGQVGVIFTTTAKIEEAGIRPESVREALVGEVETYDAYLRGEVYGYVVETADGDVLDSCWGYYDTDEAAAEGRDVAEYQPAYRRAATAAFAQAAGVGL